MSRVSALLRLQYGRLGPSLAYHSPRLRRRCHQINGSIAYAAQRAWIQNATLRDNVLFGSPMEPERYARVLSACALTADLDLLEAGDQTEIGERG